MLLILSTNNTQERLVSRLVDRLEGEIPTELMEMLLTSYSGNKIIVQSIQDLHYQFFRSEGQDWLRGQPGLR